MDARTERKSGRAMRPNPNPTEELAADWLYRNESADWSLTIALVNEALDMAAKGQPAAIARRIRSLKAKESVLSDDR